MSQLCRCYVAVMLQLCCSHVAVMLQSCCSHVAVMQQLCCSYGPVMVQLCCCHSTEQTVNYHRVYLHRNLYNDPCKILHVISIYNNFMCGIPPCSCSSISFTVSIYQTHVGLYVYSTGILPSLPSLKEKAISTYVDTNANPNIGLSNSMKNSINTYSRMR